MANTSDIRNRIKSVKNTAQITKAMELVAASKMKRAQDRAIAGRPYALLLAEILSAVGERADELKHPFLEKREVKRRGILVISTDKGLCGPLNSNLFRLVATIDRSAAFVAIGRKATQFLTRTARTLLADFSVGDRTRFAEVRLAIEFLLNAYIDGEIDTIEVLYTRFLNTLLQEPTLDPLVPLDNLDEVIHSFMASHQATADTHDAKDTREMLFEPGADFILDELVSLYIKREIYHRVLEAKASEQSARMVAMKTATDNANTLVDELTLEYNKARQAAITQEILEISAATFS